MLTVQRWYTMRLISGSQERKWVVGSCTIALLLTGMTSLASYQNAIRIAESTEKVKRTREVIETLVGLLATLNEAEAGRRGYVLLGDKIELDRHQQAIRALNPALQHLTRLIATSPTQQPRLAELSTLLTQRREISQTSLATYQRGVAPATQRDLSAASRRNRLQIRQVVSAMQQQEEQTLERWVQESQASIQTRMWIELLGSFLSFLILLGVFSLLYLETQRRNQAEKRELQLAKDKELGELKLQLFSMTSHEFRTPLSIILGSAELLEETLQPIVEKPKLKNLYRIQTYAQLMTRLLNDILMLARAEAGQLEFHPQWVEMQAFCLNLVEDMQVLSESKHRIQFMKQGNVSRAWADPKLLYSILSNLLMNAIKYSPSGQDIYFTLIGEPDATVFRIRDQGIGMSPELQHEGHQPFQRGNNAQQIAGNGLGLALVYRCLELHHGQMQIESEASNGSCFTVILPNRLN